MKKLTINLLCSVPLNHKFPFTMALQKCLSIFYLPNVSLVIFSTRNCHWTIHWFNCHREDRSWWRKSKLKSVLESIGPPCWILPSFLNINKRPGVSLLPLGWNASSSQGICKNQFKTPLAKKTTTIKATFGDVKTWLQPLCFPDGKI